MTTGDHVSKHAPAKQNKSSGGQWLKRIGIAGFLFFLIKGILWLVLLGLVVFGIVDKEAMNTFREWLPF